MRSSVGRHSHQVVLHARNAARTDDAKRAVPGAEAIVEGDLDTIAGAKEVAARVNDLGRFDAVIHNAAVGYREGHTLTTSFGRSADGNLRRALGRHTTEMRLSTRGCA
jgi:NAD(P)-dependent dehydrogenase (short-subunit alcohol dehydrogenase family)